MFEVKLPNSEMAKKIVKQNTIEKKEERRKIEEATDLALEKLTENWLNKIKESINQAIDTNITIVVYMEDFHKFKFERKDGYFEYLISSKDAKELVIKTIENIFIELGYGFKFTEYSESWQHRSGKFGLISLEF